MALISGLITFGVGPTATTPITHLLLFGLNMGAAAPAVTPVVSRSVGIDSNPSDALSLDSNPSDTLTLDSNPSDALAVNS